MTIFMRKYREKECVNWVIWLLRNGVYRKLKIFEKIFSQ